MSARGGNLSQGNAPPENTHTILLVQPEEDKYSRTYYDFVNLTEALQGICDLFENRLRELNRASGVMQLMYDVADLFRFVDALPDLSILILNGKATHYIPYGKTFIKNQLFRHCQEKKANR